MINNEEEVVSKIEEVLTIEMGTPDSKTVYLKFPDNFKENYDIKTASPILSTVIRGKQTTRLCFVFSNDTLKEKKKK